MANNILLPIAGKGQRFVDGGFETPKPLVKVKNQFLVERSLESVDISQSNLIFVVRKEHVKSHNIDKILKIKYGEDIKIIVIDYVTEGTLCTCLLAEDLINNEETLTIFTPDCYFEPKFYVPKLQFPWKNQTPVTIHNGKGVDGVVTTFESNSNAHSFVKLNDKGNVIEAKEKEVISNNAIAGLYFFEKGKTFVKYAKELIEKNIRVNNEFYIAPIYNLMVRDGLKITIEQNTRHDILGTPEDIEKNSLL